MDLLCVKFHIKCRALSLAVGGQNAIENSDIW